MRLDTDISLCIREDAPSSEGVLVHADPVPPALGYRELWAPHASPINSSMFREDPLQKNTPVFLPGEFHGQGKLAGYSPWGGKKLDTTWHHTPVLVPGESHGWRSLVGCSPWGREELDMTERLHFHFSLSCIGEGNGNPLQYSCLENPMDEEPGMLQSMGSQRVGHD